MMGNLESGELSQRNERCLFDSEKDTNDRKSVSNLVKAATC